MTVFPEALIILTNGHGARENLTTVSGVGKPSVLTTASIVGINLVTPHTLTKTGVLVIGLGVPCMLTVTCEAVTTNIAPSPIT